MIQELLGGNTAATTTITTTPQSSSLLLHGERNNHTMISMFTSCSTTPEHGSFFQPFHFPSPISTFTPITTPTSTIPTTGGAETMPNTSNNNTQHNSSEPAQQQNLKCPRCDSTNTKFCYYNNYNLTQPRHFCKTCRRYWTKGGALRNVPIGGGCRKNKLPTANCTAAATNIGKNYSGSSYNKAKVSFGGLSIAADINPMPYGYLESAEFSASNPSPLLWPPPLTQGSSHILSLLRSSSSTQNPNPNTNYHHHHHNPNSSGFTLKSDGGRSIVTSGSGAGSCEETALELGDPSKMNSHRNDSHLDSRRVNQIPSNTVPMNGQLIQSYNFHKENRNNSVTGDVQNSGFGEMLQKLSRDLDVGESSKVVTSMARTPMNGGWNEFGCFISSPLCWSELRPTPGRNAAAYP